MFLTEDEVSLDAVKTLIKKYWFEIFNFVDLYSGVGLVWSSKTRTRVNDVIAFIFSVKCFNPLKLYPQKVVCFIRVLLFIHEHLIIM